MIDHNYPIAKHFTITNNGIVAITAAEQHKLRMLNGGKLPTIDFGHPSFTDNYSKEIMAAVIARQISIKTGTALTDSGCAGCGQAKPTPPKINYTAQKTVGVIIEDGNDMNKTLSKGKNSKNAATIAGETSDNTTANSSNE
ncbi:MAG: hypothetical protein KA974_09985 [Saprospiraceae bacterium]|nr:hypothetical protein [Saprospiraceae bacterium]